MTFSEWLLNKFFEWQIQSKERKTLTEFAQYLGVKQNTLYGWLHYGFLPNLKHIKILFKKFDFDIYSLLGLPVPKKEQK